MRNWTYPFVFQTVTSEIPPKTAGGRWKMGVEDKWHKNRIFHQYTHLTINDMHSQRWKMEDRNVFFV
ncbi:hypothetical protein K0F03_19620 [Bacteroides fragilis]|nr:hypothetical protein [Bacteroides fragilis]